MRVFWQLLWLLHIPRFVQDHEKIKKCWQGLSESDMVVEDESVNESLSISQTKAQHLERNPPLAGKCIGSDKLPSSTVSSTWFTSILHYDVLTPITGFFNAYLRTFNEFKKIQNLYLS